MKKYFLEWKNATIILLLISLLALLLRLINLTILPVFADEAIYIRWSQIMANEPTLRFLPLSDGKQPLFMWILMFVVHRFSDPLFIGRLLSIATGMGTLLGIFALSLILFKSKKAALVSALIYAVSPFTFFFDRMALVDSMLAMFTIWTIVLGILTAKTKYPSFAMLTGFTLGGALLTKSPAIFTAILLPTTWVLSDFPRKKEKLALHILQAVFLLSISFLIALTLYNIQRLGPNFHMLALRTKDYVYPISHLWENPKDPFKPYFHRGLKWIWIMGPSFLYSLAAISLLVRPKKFVREKLLLLLWFIFPLSIQAMFAKTFTARYILFALPPLFVLSGISSSYNNKKVLHFAYLFLLIFILQSSIFNLNLLTDPQKANLPRSERSGYLEEWTAGTGIKEVADYLKKEAKKNPDTQIIVGTEGYFGTLPDGLQMYLENISNITVIGIGLNIKEPHKSLLESKTAGNKTYLLANSSRLKFEEDPQNLGLKLIMEIKKANRPEWIRERVQFGSHDFLRLYELSP